MNGSLIMIVLFISIAHLSEISSNSLKSQNLNTAVLAQVNTIQPTATGTTPTTIAPKTTTSNPTDILLSNPNAVYTYAKVTNCNTNNCSPFFGFCVSTEICKCQHGFANIPKSTQICNYKQKYQITAFLLEFFLSFGVGHFYIGLWYLGLVKLLLAIILPVVLCVLSCCKPDLAYLLAIWYIVFPLVIGIWWLVDAILFGLNVYKDINGVPLAAW